MTNVYEDKVIIVTGGTSGIGYCLCEELLKRGAIVHVIGSKQSSVEKAQKELGKYPNARFAPVDVRDNAAVEKMVNDCVRQDGRLDYLFNNAGISHLSPYELVTMDLWKDMVDINLWGVVYGINAALNVMRKQGSGHIINLSSVAALFYSPFQPVYVATKCAVAGLTRSLRYEYEPRNIYFTVVYPGNVATPIFKGNNPPDAIPPEEAVEPILEGVSQKKLSIIFPQSYEDTAKIFKFDDIMEREMRKYAEEKRESFKNNPELQYEEKVESLFKK
ncbi:MAG TPA: SDR family oxidoreductase [Methanospirillum sp.]|uniref:SDR family oxidoreductase n=1 Tax=Methanospirillum sp. TaxID=45200 RepID=UPI002CA1716A|nr:SDR family oxidoreductase [Methanospirillum sp.]HOJ96748.1 SDR family oxidoreductase [Methanospirillum sp.]HOL40884.1 SDR family oxidoreductase [Methanospirillum sp.]HPP78277.1 SDR family oxidoreductase [Methanospirillum sp.]